jgi:hypothetical protein
MTVSRQVRYTLRPRRGRHAIQRARAATEASRLRHAQVLLPRGVHRTRVSEMRPRRVPAVVRLVRIPAATPFPLLERNLALRLPASTG